MDEQLDAANGIDLRVKSAGLPDDFQRMHDDLDEVELRLTLIRERQAALMGKESPTRVGSIRELDLRTMIQLVDEDDKEFDERFDQFAGADSSGNDRARRWMEDS